ncbi:hypothetical protein AXG93_312s1000 [Marchantia polymorpha subsp. ruderalis]|uniref:Uncharacterized protein n=1 Tax=Marchantia polymorpha subsp. ruderalis TaxID=1480154 RepID=A0A176W7S0_MARPO|nr:hypothetical protein AXG93_312s1000 [Marchantia polymorpha subsp. ruderalis]
MIFDRELWRRVRDATLLSDASPTLAYVFALSEKIELNIVEEKVVTSSFARDKTTTPRVPQSTAQSRPFDGGSGGGRGAQTRHQTAARDTRARAPMPLFVGIGASTSTFHEGEDFSYLASAAQVETSVAVTRDATRAPEPRGATEEFDPQRDEGGRQAKLH